MRLGALSSQLSDEQVHGLPDNACDLDHVRLGACLRLSSQIKPGTFERVKVKLGENFHKIGIISGELLLLLD